MATVLNGRLPAEQLVVIPWDGRDRIRFYALASLARLNAAFRARFSHDLIVNEGYRDLTTQQRYYANPPSGAGTAAVPGTSNHGWGLAVDLKLTAAEYAWMRANAPAYGWINPLWARDGRGVEEPWHWEHVGAPAVVPDPITPRPEEDNMAKLMLIAWQADGRQYIGDLITRRWIHDDDERKRVIYQVNAANGLGGEAATSMANAQNPANRFIVLREVGRVDDIDWLGVDVTGTEATTLVTAVAKALPAATSGAVIDYAALGAAVAKVVNDEAARRMAS